MLLYTVYTPLYYMSTYYIYFCIEYVRMIYMEVLILKILIKIDHLLEERDKTIYWLSKQTGISHNNLTKMAKNETNSIRFDKLIDIMNALEIKHISDILEVVED